MVKPERRQAIPDIMSSTETGSLVQSLQTASNFPSSRFWRDMIFTSAGAEMMQTVFWAMSSPVAASYLPLVQMTSYFPSERFFKETTSFNERSLEGAPIKTELKAMANRNSR